MVSVIIQDISRLFTFFREANLALEPYKAALNEVNNSINDQLEKIASVKRKILLNEDKISKLIFNIGKRN